MADEPGTSPAALGRVAFAFAILLAVAATAIGQGIVTTQPWTNLALGAYAIGAPTALVLGLLAGHRWRRQSTRTAFPVCGLLAAALGGIATVFAIVLMLAWPSC